MIEIRVDKPLYAREFHLHLFELLPDGGAKVAKEPEFERVGPDVLWPTPFTRISTTAAQQLMDELWRCGLRPTEGSGSAGSLAATQAHLDDMRTIAFNVLKIKKGN